MVILSTTRPRQRHCSTSLTVSTDLFIRTVLPTNKIVLIVLVDDIFTDMTVKELVDQLSTPKIMSVQQIDALKKVATLLNRQATNAEQVYHDAILSGFLAPDAALAPEQISY